MTAVLDDVEIPTVGSQVPKHLIAPGKPGKFYSDHAEDAVDYAASYGLVADPWQETTCEAWMRQDSVTGKWLAGTWAITVSRQNGKNGTLEIVELYGMVKLGLRFLHTAHEVKTARKAFARLKHFFGEKVNDPNARFPTLNAMVREVRNTNGQEAIVLKHPTDPQKDGGSVEFIARSKGSGRGFTVDVLVLDEAQDLQEDHLQALKPTTSAAPSGDPVTIYMGTPPAEVGLVGEPFIRVRKKAIEGETTRTAWVEFGATGEVDDMSPQELEDFVRDPRNWADGNPAWGTRINQQTIEDELTEFSAHSFARERLNMWPRTSSTISAVQKSEWDARKIDIDDVDPDWPILAIGLDMNPARTKVTIGVIVDAGFGEPLHAELAADAPFDEKGTSALVDWLWKRAKRRVPIVIDYYSPAKSIEAHLKRKKMLVRVLGTSEFTQACAIVYDAIVKDKSITHIDQEPLNDSLMGVFKEKIGDKGGFKFSPISADTDLGPIMSIVCAYFGAIKFARRRRVSPAGETPHAIIST